jgi:hypothetical protein
MRLRVRLLVVSVGKRRKRLARSCLGMLSTKLLVASAKFCNFRKRFSLRAMSPQRRTRVRSCLRKYDQRK